MPNIFVHRLIVILTFKLNLKCSLNKQMYNVNELVRESWHSVVLLLLS